MRALPGRGEKGQALTQILWSTFFRGFLFGQNGKGGGDEGLAK